MFTKSVFQAANGDWQYNIFGPDGVKCVFQDFNPTISGAVAMTEAEAHQFADACIADISPPIVEQVA